MILTSFNQLLTEYRVDREKVYIIGIPCDGKVDESKLRAQGAEGVTGIVTDGDIITVSTLYGDVQMKKSDVIAERCVTCKSKKVVAYDEMMGENGEVNPDCGRFDQVAELEAMTPDERFAFWRDELSKCIRCNACRNICPACTCENVSSTIRSLVFLRRQQQILLKKICSILFVHSM